MSTPEINKIIKTAAHTSRGINKNLLTPCRRIGLSRNRKSSNRNSFISPLENKDPSHVNIEVNGGSENIKNSKDSDSLNVTPVADIQNGNKRKLKKIDNQDSETKKQVANENKDEPVSNTSKCVEKINASNKKSETVRNRDEIKVEEVANENKNGPVSSIKKYSKEINITNKKSKNTHNQDEIKIDKQNSNKSVKCDKELNVLIESSKITQNKRRKYVIDSDEEESVCNGFENIKSSNESKVKKCLNYNSKNIDSDTKKFKKKNIISSSDNNKGDINSENKMQIALNQLNNSNKIIDSITGMSPNTEVLTKQANHMDKLIRVKGNDNDLSYEGKQCNKPNKNISASKISEDISSSISQNGKLIRIDYKKDGNKEEVTTNGNSSLKNQLSESTEEIKLKKSKSVKRKFSMKKSSSNSDLIESDEEVFVKTPNQLNRDLEELESTQIVDKIIEVDKRLQNKEMELGKLQQAQVYRSLHKLEDLKRETDVWKIGCQNALRDLLVKLKEHAAIDMNTLLLNLKVPMHLFKYDNENDCFL